MLDTKLRHVKFERVHDAWFAADESAHVTQQTPKLAPELHSHTCSPPSAALNQADLPECTAHAARPEAVGGLKAEVEAMVVCIITNSSAHASNPHGEGVVGLSIWARHLCDLSCQAAIPTPDTLRAA